MDHVILIRMPNGVITALMESAQGGSVDRIKVFPDRDAAVDVAIEHPLCQALPHQIVECDEL